MGWGCDRASAGERVVGNDEIASVHSRGGGGGALEQISGGVAGWGDRHGADAWGGLAEVVVESAESDGVGWNINHHTTESGHEH
jgi:hypothetical protein